MLTAQPQVDTDSDLAVLLKLLQLVSVVARADLPMDTPQAVQLLESGLDILAETHAHVSSEPLVCLN